MKQPNTAEAARALTNLISISGQVRGLGDAGVGKKKAVAITQKALHQIADMIYGETQVLLLAWLADDNPPATVYCPVDVDCPHCTERIGLVVTSENRDYDPRVIIASGGYDES